MDVTTNDALIVLPCYNERENLERLIEEILALGAGFDVLVIDDNSPDGTGELAEALAARHPEVGVRRRPGKLGLGSAYREGFEQALEHGYQYVVTMDADFSHQPRYLPALRGLCYRECDVALGSRYVEGGGTEGWPLHRRLVSAFANGLARRVLGISVHDCTTGFRCYRREALLSVGPSSVLSDGYSFLIEMVYRVEQRGLGIGELPITFVDRRAGKSKVSRIEIYRALYTLARLRFPDLPWQRIVPIAVRYGEAGLLSVGLGASLLLGTSLLVLRRQK